MPEVNNDAVQSKIFSIAQQKYKESCLTCKIRKKRCSKEHPICADCKRLNKNCVWVDDNMTIQEVRNLKKEVEINEKKSRLKRKLDSQTHNIKALTKKRKRKGKIPDDDRDNIPYNLNSEGFSLLQFDIEDFNVCNKTMKSLKRSKSQTSKDSLVTTNEKISLEGDRLSVQSSPDSDFIFFDDIKSFMDQSELEFRNPSPGFLPAFDQLDNKREDSITSPIDIAIENQKEKEKDSGNEDSSLVRLEYPIPKPISNTNVSLNLDETGVKLFDYYRNHLSKVVSIVPQESNYYVNLFLPMASVNSGILSSILSWSAAHMGNGYEEESEKYMKKTLEYLESSLVLKADDEIASQNLSICMILVSAEICRGDVYKWSSLMKIASNVIKDNGGLFKFNKNKEKRFLISNFVYHDVLASYNNGTYFPLEDYQKLGSQEGLGVDPLQGIVKPVFGVIGEISLLATEARDLMEISTDSLGDCIMTVDYMSKRKFIKNPNKNSRYSSLLTIVQKSALLEDKIDSLKPDPLDLHVFSLKELELQLTLFELFQFTAKLHLRQSVLKLNSSSLETQFLVCEALKSLDVLLRSSVESSLCFPMFISGINCTRKGDRDKMIERFDKLIERFHYKNLERAKFVMLKVWELDPLGKNCVDWYDLVKELDWNLSFA